MLTKALKLFGVQPPRGRPPKGAPKGASDTRSEPRSQWLFRRYPGPHGVKKGSGTVSSHASDDAPRLPTQSHGPLRLRLGRPPLMGRGSSPASGTRDRSMRTRGTTCGSVLAPHFSSGCHPQTGAWAALD